MVAGFQTFDRDLRLAIKDLQPKEVSRELARFARAELSKAIQSGEASTTYDRFVNGRKGAVEESVVAPGPIVYVFTNWPLVIRTAMVEFDKRVPKRSGRYASGFIVLAGGAPVRSFDAIKPEQEVIIFNVRPYTRKMEVGANRTGKRHFERTRQALQRRFGAGGEGFSFQVKYLTIPAGIHPQVPYRLRRLNRRRDRSAGAVLNYPALVMNAGG